MQEFPKVNCLAMLATMAAAILGRSCDHGGDEGKSHDQMTNEHFNPKRVTIVKEETNGANV